MNSTDTLSFLSHRRQLLILVILALGLNINTLRNQYALDDVVVMTGNSLVKKGIKGIPELLTKDMFYGLDKKGNDLSGGRYRPLSLVLFALEHEVFGESPFVSHLINVLLFTMLILLLFLLLQRHLFREQHDLLAFLTCLVFVVHPVHTEVIANVKSRDEIIAFILLLLSSFSLIHYAEERKLSSMAWALLCFFLALLCRESAVPFIVIVPLVAWFFYHQDIRSSLKWALPLAVVFIAYMILRTAMVGFSQSTPAEVLNAPYLYASSGEAFASKVYILCRYIWLLVFPYPLSCDYGYNQIPYVGLKSILFLASLLVWAGLGFYAVYTFRVRSLVSFCILFFVSGLFLFSNFVINIGAPLAERLLFQPSLGFCIILACLFLKVSSYLRTVAVTTLGTILLLFSIKTIQRNSDWESNETLYCHDVESAPNSVRTNMYAAHLFITKAQEEKNPAVQAGYFHKAVGYDERIVNMDPHYAPIYEDLGVGYFGLKNYLRAADNWARSYSLDPENPYARKRVDMISDVLYNEGNRLFKLGKADSAIIRYQRAVDLNESNVDAWYNLGTACFSVKKASEGRQAWQVVARLKPDYPFKTGAR
ncbi:MAG: tetratricopeptide repeat protein [Bacteroidia bacterium]